MNPVSMAKGLFTDDKGLSVDTELTVGDKQESQELQVGNRITAREVQNTTINEMKWGFLLLLILGWLLPSPSQMWKAFVRLLPWVK